MRGRPSGFGLVIAGALALLTATAHAADPFEDLADADKSPTELAQRLYEVAGRITRGANKVRGGYVVYCSPDAAGRAVRAAELDQVVKRGVAALREIGLGSDDRPPETTVIEVEARGGFVGAVESQQAQAVLVRTGAGEKAQPTARGALPRLDARSDGPATARDAVAAAGRQRVELWSRRVGSSSGASSVYDVLADRLLRWGGPDEDSPEWLRVGLRGWLASRLSDEPLPMPGHVCGASGATELVKILDPERTAPEHAATHLARVVEVLASRKAPLVAGAAKFASAAPRSDAAFEAAFGVPASDVAASAFPSEGSEDGCVDGTLACPLCDGAGDIEIACPDCRGTGAVGCTSCFGSQVCSATGCIGGKHYFVTGDVERCGYCGGSGTQKCKACKGKGASACGSCKRGSLERECPGCVGGKIPCPQSGGGDALARACGEVSGTPCTWCRVKGVKTFCSQCDGAGYRGCRTCFGTLRALCDSCGGSGAEIMVYSDGTKASSTKCSACSGKGYSRCGACDGGSRSCTCDGKGTEPLTPANCPLCEGTGQLPDVAKTGERRRLKRAPPSADEARAIHEAIDEGVGFLLRCKSGDSFTLLNIRGSKIGSKMTPNLFANSLAIWTLSTAGITSTDPRVAGPFARLKAQALDLVEGSVGDAGTQEAALALRALVGAGADPDDDTVKELVKLLVKGQQADGLWSGSLGEKEDGSAFDTLFAVESLWLAQRRGVNVSRGAFTKALRAGSRLFGSSGFDKQSYVTGTEVCSATALVVISKAGSLGDAAGTFDYMSLDAVKEGIAWLDRYLDIRAEPVLSNGAYVRSREDRGYAAYLFAIQRLGSLLSIETLGGERWYTTGARALVAAQRSAGDWGETARVPLNGPVRSTCSSVLFLTRATPSVTESRDQ